MPIPYCYEPSSSDSDSTSDGNDDASDTGSDDSECLADTSWSVEQTFYTVSGVNIVIQLQVCVVGK